MKILLKILFLLLAAAAVYAGFSAYNPVRGGMAAVVADKKSGNVVSVIAKERRFVPYSALTWKYSVEMLPLKSSVMRDIRVDIPALKELDRDAFSIIIPIKVDFTIRPELPNLNLLKNAAAGFTELLERELKAELGFLLQDYLTPAYRSAALIEARDDIIKKLNETISAKFANEGINIDDLRYMSAISLPDNRRYEEGLVYLENLRRMLIENDRKLIEIKGQLERDAQSTESLYKKYREISLIINENPAILKYIYIDKMAGNLKLIISSDKSAFPAFLDENAGAYRENKSKENKASREEPNKETKESKETKTDNSINTAEQGEQ